MTIEGEHMELKKSFKAATTTNADGTIEIVFATIGVIDRDGDVLVKGAITDGAEALISGYNHSSWTGALPVGKGTIHEIGNEAIFRGRFFLDTTASVETHATVKNVGDLQEWSWSLHDVVAVKGNLKGVPCQFLQTVATVKEVSPVVRGAGINSRTLQIKSTKQLGSSLQRLLHLAGRERWPEGYSWVEDYDLDEGFVVYCRYLDGESLIRLDYARTDTSVILSGDEVEVHETAVFLPKSFSDHRGQVLASVEDLVTRTTEIKALRGVKGKALNDEANRDLQRIVSLLEKLKSDVSTELTDDPELANREELARLKMRFFASQLEGES